MTQVDTGSRNDHCICTHRVASVSLAVQETCTIGILGQCSAELHEFPLKNAIR